MTYLGTFFTTMKISRYYLGLTFLLGQIPVTFQVFEKFFYSGFRQECRIVQLFWAKVILGLLLAIDKKITPTFQFACVIIIISMLKLGFSFCVERNKVLVGEKKIQISPIYPFSSVFYFFSANSVNKITDRPTTMHSNTHEIKKNSIYITHTHIHTYIHTYIHTHTHTHTHTHSNTHKHTHKQTQTHTHPTYPQNNVAQFLHSFWPV